MHLAVDSGVIVRIRPAVAIDLVAEKDVAAAIIVCFKLRELVFRANWKRNGCAGTFSIAIGGSCGAGPTLIFRCGRGGISPLSAAGNPVSQVASRILMKIG